MRLLEFLRTVVQSADESEVEVDISRCYHFRGFRYGGYGHNPYEDYILGLAAGADRRLLRSRFAAAMLSSRPRTMSQVLGIDAGTVAAWDFPWNGRWRRPPKPPARPQDNPDIVCHYCEGGVLASHINREFGWLDGAFDSIRTLGYRPQAHGFVRCLELTGEAGSSFIVLDGNHRLSSMHALGMRSVVVRRSTRRRVLRARCGTWPRVAAGAIPTDVALRIFDRYFWAQNPPLPQVNEGRLIVDETPLWTPADRAPGGDLSGVGAVASRQA